MWDDCFYYYDTILLTVVVASSSGMLYSTSTSVSNKTEGIQCICIVACLDQEVTTLVVARASEQKGNQLLVVE